MALTNQTSGDVFWAFASADETVNGQPVEHLWNFTSSSGHGWLV